MAIGDRFNPTYPHSCHFKLALPPRLGRGAAVGSLKSAHLLRYWRIVRFYFISDGSPTSPSKLPTLTNQDAYNKINQ